MLLHSVEIQGFKGIKDLYMNFNSDISVLIGENSWGSSSLLAALAVITKENFLYDCQDHDFYHDEDCSEECLTLRFTYIENPLVTEESLQVYPELADVSYFSPQLRKNVICYQVTANRVERKITTYHHFIDDNEEIIETDNFPIRLRRLLDISPLIIFRSNRRYEPILKNEDQRVKAFYDLLAQQLSKDNDSLTERELKQGLYAATLLLTYYLVNNKQDEEHIKKPTLEDWQVLDKINDLLDQMDNATARNVMMKFFSSIIFYRMGYSLPENALPILCLKNFGNTHPIVTSVGMRLLNNIPVQKILTSNTSDLIPILALPNVIRISRSESEIVANQVMPKELSASTNRKVLFHIFHRRPVALFARCWFLVEGETEIWLLRELAEICGHNLNAEGIALVEFAQCGVLPLIEYAEAMGIEWYVMSDGDAAGRHYAKTVRSHCRDKETYYRHMTQLPSRDIENFLFQKGFSSVYKEIAYGSSEFVNVPVHEIIQKAIQKSSKPDLALAVCDYARVRGARAIPSLLQKTFKKVIELSKGSMSS
jgi:putative ATP-dependent endonuclease of OLD family